MSVEWACGMMGYLPIYQLESRRNVSQSMASKTSLWEKKSRKTTTTENVLPCRTQWAESLIKYHPVWTKRFLINVVKHWLNHLMVSGKDSSISNNTSPQIHLCLRRKQREKQKERGSEATKKKRKLFNHAVCHKVPCKASKTCLAGLLLLFRTRFFWKRKSKNVIRLHLISRTSRHEFAFARRLLVKHSELSFRRCHGNAVVFRL